MRKSVRQTFSLSLMLGAAVMLSACQRSEPGSDAAAGASAPVATPPANYTIQVNDAASFETQGKWSDGYKKAVGKGAGVVVGPGAGNENVFAQTFKTRAGERFKVSAVAASVDQPSARGRLQINWIDANGQFLSVWSETFDVGPEPKPFSAELVAPANAAAGTLYVVGDADSVVRYTEMKLMGEAGRTE